MASKINHTRFLNYAARTILQSNGLFQKGQSRTWIDDNGWFLIIVEIQPKDWNKGAYLKVGIDYLWRNKNKLTMEYGHNQKEFIAFRDREESFYNDLLIMYSVAMEKVEEYRKFADIAYAKRKISGVNRFSSNAHELYNKMMICGLAEDSQAVEYYKKLLERVYSVEEASEKVYLEELTEEWKDFIYDTGIFKAYIQEKIKVQREYWHNTSAMKKLDIDF